MSIERSALTCCELVIARTMKWSRWHPPHTPPHTCIAMLVTILEFANRRLIPTTMSQQRPSLPFRHPEE